VTIFLKISSIIEELVEKSSNKNKKLIKIFEEKKSF